MNVEIKCKHCNSARINKTGIQRYKQHRYQRYICRDCYRLSVFKLTDVITEVEADPIKNLTSTTKETIDT